MNVQMFDVLFLIMVLVALSPLLFSEVPAHGSAAGGPAAAGHRASPKHCRITKHYRALLAEFHLRRRQKRSA